MTLARYLLFRARTFPFPRKARYIGMTAISVVPHGALGTRHATSRKETDGALFAGTLRRSFRACASACVCCVRTSGSAIAMSITNEDSRRADCHRAGITERDSGTRLKSRSQETITGKAAINSLHEYLGRFLPSLAVNAASPNLINLEGVSRAPFHSDATVNRRARKVALPAPQICVVA